MVVRSSGTGYAKIQAQSIEEMASSGKKIKIFSGEEGTGSACSGLCPACKNQHGHHENYEEKDWGRGQEECWIKIPTAYAEELGNRLLDAVYRMKSSGEKEFPGQNEQKIGIGKEKMLFQEDVKIEKNPEGAGSMRQEVDGVQDLQHEESKD